LDKEEIKLQATRVFYENLNCKKKIVINRGGARSSKTYSLMQLFIQKFLTERKKRFLIIRKTLPALKVSVWETFKMVLDDFGMNTSSFKQEKVMMNFYYMDNLLHFGGLDDPEKIKSTEWNYEWLEEATDFTLQDYEILKLRLSAFSSDRKRNQMFLSFNPIDEEHWIKTDIMDNVNEEDKAEIVSTYKDNPFLSDDYIKQIKALENQNRNFYRIYTCGEWGRLEDLIYSNYNEVEADPDEGDYQEIIYGVDFGYNNPSTLLKIWVGEDKVWEKGLLYRSGLTNQELIKEFDKLIPLDLRNCPIYADSAEPDRIDEINRAGYLCIPFKKGQKSVINGINFIKMLKIRIVNSGDDKLLKEKRSYSWKTGKNGKPTDEPVKFGDHYMDAERGALYTHLDGSREFKVRWL